MIEKENEEVERLSGELEEAKDRRRENASLSKGGIWYLIECGVDHLEETVEEGTAEASILPGDDIEFAIITFLESRAKGKYNRRRTGGDMTHGKGMNALENFGEVTRGLIGMYDIGTEEYEWLKIKSAIWDRLAEKLYAVCCFMKSQEKTMPRGVRRQTLRAVVGVERCVSGYDIS